MQEILYYFSLQWRTSDSGDNFGPRMQDSTNINLARVASFSPILFLWSTFSSFPGSRFAPSLEPRSTPARVRFTSASTTGYVSQNSPTADVGCVLSDLVVVGRYYLQNTQHPVDHFKPGIASNSTLYNRACNRSTGPHRPTSQQHTGQAF